MTKDSPLKGAEGLKRLQGMSLRQMLWFEIKQMPAMHCCAPKLKQRSRELRQDSTLAEVLLWNQEESGAARPAGIEIS